MCCKTFPWESYYKKVDGGLVMKKDKLRTILPELGKEMLKDFEELPSFKSLTTYSAILNRLLEISLMGPVAVQQAVEAVEEFLEARRVEVSLGTWIESWDEAADRVIKLVEREMAADQLAERLKEIIDAYVGEEENL
jgi:hypothetical protein